MLLFQIITLFPERYEIFFNSGLPAKAIQKKLISIRPVQLRDFADPERKGRVDDAPYGGGPGMILQVGPIYRALQSLPVKLPVILLTPSGERLNQSLVRTLFDEASSGNRKERGDDGVTGGFTLICGFYEGVDQRVAEYLVDREVSLGDFILNSGDPAALCLIEAVSRLVPGFMGKMESADEESFEAVPDSDSNGERVEDIDTAKAGPGQLLEYPQYSRPADFMGWKVPEILLSGHHGEVRKWRMEQRLERTRNRGSYEHRTGTGSRNSGSN
ncbi:MAG: tRNA (guanosine(37)-N1)-methyltransferase TrmD [Spirochaetae bacterium HGW-Spirochaetae-10]|nr:MAG: tRNA (guanosine(37)-N1)-methyltransferase TrmD [Spirochaetae bacterium HGW-Spirochaetae-10]